MAVKAPRPPSKTELAQYDKDRAAMAQFLDRYTDNSGLFVQEVFGVDPYPWQMDALRAYDARNRRISIRSGHHVGKTALLSWISVHQILFRFPQKTICTAASEPQLKDGLISEVKTWIGRLKPDLQALFDVQVERILLKSVPEESFISFRVSKAENPESLAGIHSKYVLLIVDEASGVPDTIFESASGSMADKNAVMILAGNPVRNTGVFRDSQTKHRESWTTFHISSLDCPWVSPDFIDYERKTYGDRSNRFRIRVLGEFALGDDNTVIPYELADAALTRDVKPIENVRPIWGVDCARFGQDASALAKRRANVLMEKTKTWYGLDTMILVGTVKAEWDQTRPDDRPSEIMVDVIGIGAGVTDRLRELQLPARGINVSESPAIGTSYRNLRTELWFRGKEWLAQRHCALAGDQALVDELVSPTFKVLDSTGRMMVETKQEMKSRGIESPNRADAFLLTFATEHAIAQGHQAGRFRPALKRLIKGIV